MAGADVTRLPTQHRDHPRCPACDGALPTLDGMTIVMPLVPETHEVRLLYTVFEVRCPCGAAWQMRKDGLRA